MFLNTLILLILVCSLYHDSFPKIKLKKKKKVIHCLAYSIAIYRNILYLKPCILMLIVSDSCPCTALTAMFTLDLFAPFILPILLE